MSNKASHIKQTGYIKKSFSRYKKDLVLVGVIGLFFGIVNLAFPLAAWCLFDSVLLQTDLAWHFFVLAGLAVAFFVNFLNRITFESLIGRVGLGSLDDILLDSLKHLLSLPAYFFSLDNKASVSSLINLFNKQKNTILRGDFTSLFLTFFTVANLFLLWFLNVYLALVAWVLIGTYFVVLYKLFNAYEKSVQTADNNGMILESQVTETIEGISKIKVAGAEERFLSLWTRLLSKVLPGIIDTGFYENRILTLNLLFRLFSVLAFYGTIAFLGVDTLSVGRLTGFFIAYFLFIYNLSSVSSIFTSLVDAKVLIKGLEPVFNAAPEVVNSTTADFELKGELELRQVSFRYPNSRRQVLSKVNLKVMPGEMVGLVGPSGTGKSSIFSLLLGFDRCSAGEVLIDGHQIEKVNMSYARNSMGVVHQGSGLFASSIKSNIVLSRKFSQAEIDRVLEICCLQELVDSLPMGLNTIVSNAVGVSGGQKQRILLARALIGKPKVLFLDEATSALDNETESRIEENLAKLDVSRIYVAHRLATLKNAARIYVLERGVVVQQGSFQELISKPGLFSKMADLQLA